MKRATRLALAAIAGVALAAVAWAAFAPVPVPAGREAAFTIAPGTWERRMRGDEVAILPDRMRLTLGVADVLRLENHDAVPQTFGPVLLMPGQTFRLPFARAGEYAFACTAHASGQMTIVVDDRPDGPWGRLRWRVVRLVDGLGAHRGAAAHT